MADTGGTVEYLRIPDAYWCDEHQTVHIGEFRSDWSIDHQAKLHKVYVHSAPTRPAQLGRPNA